MIFIVKLKRFAIDSRLSSAPSKLEKFNNLLNISRFPPPPPTLHIVGNCQRKRLEYVAQTNTIAILYIGLFLKKCGIHYF